MKKVAFKMPKAATGADQWVASTTRNDRERPSAAAVPMKRFTLDVPDELHKRIKTQCAMKGLKMAEFMREVLEREFPPKS